MTTLNTFMPYLSNKNIALMKLDVEGYELKVLEGGKELITKYHVPFIVLEFSPTYIRYVGYNPRDLAQFLVDNGYKISLKGFLSKDYITVNELLEIFDSDTLRFLDMSLGSLAELETQVIIAKELNFIDDNVMLLENIKQLNAIYIGLRQYLKSKTE
jgi:hypothetical protein